MLRTVKLRLRKHQKLINRNPLCPTCLFWRGGCLCAGFRGYIPDKILTGEVLHTKPLDQKNLTEHSYWCGDAPITVGMKRGWGELPFLPDDVPDHGLIFGVNAEPQEINGVHTKPCVQLQCPNCVFWKGGMSCEKYNPLNCPSGECSQFVAGKSRHLKPSDAPKEWFDDEYFPCLRCRNLTIHDSLKLTCERYPNGLYENFWSIRGSRFLYEPLCPELPDDFAERALDEQARIKERYPAFFEPLVSDELELRRKALSERAEKLHRAACETWTPEMLEEARQRRA